MDIKQNKLPVHLTLFAELEEVYDHLEEVLQQLEGATPGPRTAAIAQLAHNLLKVNVFEVKKYLIAMHNMHLFIFPFFFYKENKWL